MWYGKAPGVDRTGDVFKHANFAGTFPTGGVLAVAGDDHGCKSSTLPSQSEFAFQDFEMPVLSPADVQEVLDYGVLGIALSRFSGLWTGMIALADTMDSGVTIDVSLDRHNAVIPDFPFPPGGLGIRLKDQPMEKERRMRLHKLPAALAFARANHIDRVVLGASHVRVGKARLGIVCQGQAYKDVLEAFTAMGMTLQEAADLGVSIYKVGMPWPLEPAGSARLRRRPRDPDGHRAQARPDRAPVRAPRCMTFPRKLAPASSARSTSAARRCSRSSARCRWPKSRSPSTTACRTARTWSGRAPI